MFILSVLIDLLYFIFYFVLKIIFIKNNWFLGYVDRDDLLMGSWF